MMKKKIKVLIGMALVATAMVALAGCGAKEDSKEINLMTWADFVPREIIEQFEEESLPMS